MSCARFEPDLSAWIDGELAAPRAAEIETHVAACAACRTRVDALRRADAALRAIPLRELRPDALAEIARRIETGAPAPGRARVRFLGFGAASAAAAAASLALYLATRPDPLDTASPEDLAVAIDLDTAIDLEVIANLDLLEAMVALEGGRG